jgi:hypothetical protein
MEKETHIGTYWQSQKTFWPTQTRYNRPICTQKMNKHGHTQKHIQETCTNMQTYTDVQSLTQDQMHIERNKDGCTANPAHRQVCVLTDTSKQHIHLDANTKRQTCIDTHTVTHTDPHADRCKQRSVQTCTDISHRRESERHIHRRTPTEIYARAYIWTHTNPYTPHSYAPYTDRQHIA